MNSNDVNPIRRFFILFLLLLVIIQSSISQDVVINEVMSLNLTVILDEFEENSDWVELYNKTSNSINLLGFHLSDDPEEPDKWTFPEILIEPNGFLLVFASGRDTIGTFDLHTNFKINSEGETLIFSHANGNILDELQVIELAKDRSYGRITDGGIELETFYHTSPQLSNSNNSILNALSASHLPGIYKNEIQLSITSYQATNNIHYTLDGSEPTKGSPVFSNPLTLTSRENEPYSIAGIATTPLYGEWQLEEFIWTKPRHSINLVNVIRYRSFSGNDPSSDVISGTYFIDENLWNNHSFPVVSLISQQENLFNYDTGIYIPGKRYDQNGWGWHPDGNYMNNGIEWEREGHVELYEPDGSPVIAQDCGIRIHGGWSAKMPQKSLRIIARKKYGENKFKHQLFPELEADRYQDFVLRNSGNDFIFSHIRDAFMQELLTNLDMELLAFRPSILYINGEYWGFHGIRERYNEDYFKRHFDIDEDKLIVVGVCGTNEIGDNSYFVSMKNFIKNNNLAIQSNYDSIKQLIDIPNFIDYHIAQIYYANFDWPDNNFKMWKTTDPSSKWRCLTFDLDGCFAMTNPYDYNMIKEVVDTTNSIYDICSTTIFRNLLKNPSFKEQYVNRFLYHLENTFHRDTVLKVIDDYQEMLENEMVNHINRWNYPIHINQWKTELQILRDYAYYRPCYSKNNLMEIFNMDELDFECGENDYRKPDEQLQVEIYPNPASDFLYFTIKKFEQESITVNLYNAIGQKIINKSLWMGRYKTAEIKVDQLNVGLYILSITNGDATINKKIIIE